MNAVARTREPRSSVLHAGRTRSAVSKLVCVSLDYPCCVVTSASQPWCARHADSRSVMLWRSAIVSYAYWQFCIPVSCPLRAVALSDGRLTVPEERPDPLRKLSVPRPI